MSDSQVPLSHITDQSDQKVKKERSHIHPDIACEDTVHKTKGRVS